MYTNQLKPTFVMGSGLEAFTLNREEHWNIQSRPGNNLKQGLQPWRQSPEPSPPQIGGNETNFITYLS